MRICPTCNGTGYFADCTAQRGIVAKEAAKSSTRLHIANSLEITHPRITEEVRNLSRFDPGIDEINVNKFCKNYSDKRDCCVIGDQTKLEQNFRDESEISENFQDAMRLVVHKLKQNNWENSVSALLNVVDVSRIHPEMVDSSMPLITRSLCSLMRNVRPQVVRTACQIAEELFKTMQCTQKPEFDELVSALLQKTAHMNKGVRQDANKALDAMGKYLPVSHCVSAMSMSNAAGHKNSIVRTTVSRLLYDVVYGVGLETFLMTSHLKDARRRTFMMCIEFLNDSCIETRSNARRLVQLLMKHDDFNVVFSQEVDRSSMKKIEKQLIALKYECSNPS